MPNGVLSIKCYLCYLLNFRFEQPEYEDSSLKMSKDRFHKYPCQNNSNNLDRLLKRKTKAVATLAILPRSHLIKIILESVRRTKRPTAFRRGIHCVRAQNRLINWPNRAILPNATLSPTLPNAAIATGLYRIVSVLAIFRLLVFTNKL